MQRVWALASCGSVRCKTWIQAGPAWFEAVSGGVADGHRHPEVLLETGSAVLQDPYRIESANALDSATTSAV